MIHKKLKYALGAGLIGLSATLATPALAAGNKSMDMLLKVLRDQGTINDETYKLLKNAAAADGEHLEASAKKVEDVEKKMPKINTEEKFEVESADGNFKWKFGGRIHADAAFFDSDETDIGTNTQFRRARLDVDATLWKDWFMKWQYDFTGEGRGGIRDMFIRYNGFKPTAITVGHYKQPFSLEELTSSNNITFIERSLANAPVATLLSRRVGLGASTQIQKMFTLHGSVFSTEGPAAPADSDVDEGWGFAGRATFAPINESDRLVHLGLSGAYINASQNLTNSIRLRQRPEVGTGVRLIDTGALASVDDVTMFGAEGAVMYGPASLQGEYMMTDVDRAAGFSNPTFHGYYVEGSYMLTGESRRYSFGSGSFSNPKVKGIVGKGGYGAWQLGLRYSSLDLTDGDIRGGEQENITVGLNWYPTNNLRFMANYIHVLDVKRLELDGTPRAFHNDEPGVFLVRAQAYW